jgi:hypothetical protein
MGRERGIGGRGMGEMNGKQSRGRRRTAMRGKVELKGEKGERDGRERGIGGRREEYRREKKRGEYVMSERGMGGRGMRYE